MSNRLSLFVLGLSLLAAAACSGGGGGGAPDFGSPSTNYPAPHPSMPQLKRNGAPTDVAVNPTLVSITFANEANQAAIDDFVVKMAASNFWTATTAEYGVGTPATAAVHLAINAPANTSGSAMDAMVITSAFMGATGTWPQNNDGMIYLLFFPAGTTIADGNFVSCQSYGAYHTSSQSNPTAAYAIIPNCGGGGGLTDLDLQTFSASHEAVEAATDPYGGGYYNAAGPDAAWDYASFGGEDGDYCEYQPGVFDRPADIGYYVQDSWSNAAAAASHNPCQPNTSVYFGAAPEMPDQASLNFGNGFAEPGRGIKIKVGETKSITLDLFSDAATGSPFTVSAVDMAGYYGLTPELQFTFAENRKTGVNGEKLHLSIKATRAPNQQVNPANGHMFFIVASKGQDQYIWPAVVFNQ